MPSTRRIVMRHSSGPYPGLRQIIGTVTDKDAESGRIPDVLPAYPSPPGALWPDSRPGRLLRLRSTDRAVYYVEQAADASEAAPEAEQGAR